MLLAAWRAASPMETCCKGTAHGRFQSGAQKKSAELLTRRSDNTSDVLNSIGYQSYGSVLMWPTKNVNERL